MISILSVSVTVVRIRGLDNSGEDPFDWMLRPYYEKNLKCT